MIKGTETEFKKGKPFKVDCSDVFLRDYKKCSECNSWRRNTSFNSLNRTVCQSCRASAK